jgi:hypothetical protein
LSLLIGRHDLAIFDESTGSRVFPSGELTFFAGLSSRQIVTSHSR